MLAKIAHVKITSALALTTSAQKLYNMHAYYVWHNIAQVL